MAELSTLGAVIKTAYEGETNTNAYTDAEKSKLAGVAAGATALAIGTTSSTAKAGDYQPTWAQVSGKPTTFPPVVGTGATDAKAGNYQPTWAQVTGKPVGAAVADAVDDTDIVAQFNALLASLRTAGFIAA